MPIEAKTLFLSVCTVFFFLALSGNGWSDGGKQKLPPTMIVDETISLGGENENVYVIGNDVSVTAPVDGDIHTIAKTLDIKSDVMGDVAAIGKTITVKEHINGDARFVGQSVVVDGMIMGEMLFVGSNLSVSQSGAIQKNLVAVADRVTIHGLVNGDVYVKAGDLFVYGQVAGDIYTSGAQTVTIHSGAAVIGSIHYTKKRKNTVFVQDGASVGGMVATEKSLNTRTALIRLLKNVLFFIVAGLLAYGIFRKRWNALIPKKVSVVFLDLLLGIVVPLAITALAVFTLAMPGLFPIGSMFLSVPLLLILGGILASPIIAGAFALGVCGKKIDITLQSTGIGMAVLMALSLVPYAGETAITLCVLFVVGAGTRCIYAWLFPRNEE